MDVGISQTVNTQKHQFSNHMEMCYALDAFVVGSLQVLVTEGLVLGIRGRAIKHLLYNTRSETGDVIA